jgi:uncharacterized protein YfaS (alpha-2-macroglobulin family)/tetratricopeptide (TPR) repeat protein
MRLSVVLVFVLAAVARAQLPPEYVALKADAEKLHAEKSFARAHELYLRALGMTNLTPEEVRWAFFRNADTLWRAQAATESADTTKLEQAQRWLEQSLRETERIEQRDQTWAEVQESLADFHWTRRNQQNWGAAGPHFQQALDWWAGARDIEQARGRYLAMIWRMARPPGAERQYGYGAWGNYVSRDVLENALKIAKSEDDQAHTHYLLAMTIRNQGGDFEQQARGPEHFEAALKPGKRTDWYDDALYNYGEWMMGQGRVVITPEGGWRNEPDFLKALELFRRLVSEFSKGETRYWDQAQNQIKNITEPVVGLGIGNVFLPDSEVQYQLHWRNAKQIDLTLYAVELNRDVKLSDQRENWLQSIKIGDREQLKSWTHDPKDKGDYKPGYATLRLDDKLKPGAYLLVARGNGKEARELVLVSDAALVVKSSGKQTLAYFCNALDGAPIAGATIHLWEQWWDGSGKWQAREQTKEAGEDGIAVFELSERNRGSATLFVSGIRGDRQAFSVGYGNWYDRGEAPWKIYAVTDRPACRPKETVNWKIIARRYDGAVYTTPADQVIEFEITDPQGAKVKADKVRLNAFGSTWGSLELTEQMPLGEYGVQFWDEGRKRHHGNATLFRLEEYKLPEFKVTVATPEEDGKKKAFRTGDKVEVEIQADYYFGGPVANASVEVVVRQNPFHQYWRKPREFPWFYEDVDNNPSRWNRYYGGGQIVKRETIKTDATGKARIAFDTPRGSGQDFEYRVEARVTDASRREIIGSGQVRVTRQRYYVYAEADHNLYRPQDKVRVDFKALDANDQPVPGEGTVKVTRDYWWEIWISPEGKEVKGEELQALRSKSASWPPPSKPNEPGWRLKFRGYEHDDILTRNLKTDTNGAAEFNFTRERDGYYRVAWTSADEVAKRKNQVANPIRAETTVWVCSGKTTELGYRYQGVQIIADKDTFRVGNEAPIMLVAPTADRYVLFTVEGEDLYHHRLVHLEGTVKLIDLLIEEKHVPNIFLGATLVSDRQIFLDQKQIIVPPTKNFLTVDLKPDRGQYQPREEGTLTVTTKNDEGKPVSAEIALSLVDESVFYIQSDYAGDPRQFYFGTKRNQFVQTQATMNQKSYAKLVLGDKDQLLDERDKERREGQARNEAEWKDFDGFAMDASKVAEAETASAGGMAGGRGRLISRNAAMPTAAAAPMLNALGKAEGAKQKTQADMPAQPPGGEEPAVVVRSDFRSTIVWQPDVKTDANGTATVKVKYPDSLTGWKATARASSSGNQFGIADAVTRTKQPLIVRLQAPRFFVVGDTVTISAVVNNNTEEALEVRVALDASGLVVGPVANDAKKSGTGATPVLRVAPNSEARADWTAVVKQSGEVKLKVTGRGGKFSDAMEKSYYAHEHGIEKFISKSGKARGNDITVKLELPAARKAEATALTVQVTPSLAVTMLDALPYLIDYPYGCTEQTMSRFLPAVITAKTLRDVGLDPEDVMGRVFGGIETNSATATHPKGKKDLAELDAITKAGLERLYDFQHSDGGWGWWKDGESDHWMTAYVVWGLALARDAKLKIKEDVLNRGRDFLAKEIVEEEENPDLQAFMLHALGAYYALYADQLTSPSVGKALDNLWTRRESLNAYTRALLALSAHYFHRAEQAKTLIENLENGVKRDERPDRSILIGGQPENPGVMGTAHWGEDGIYWRWSEGGVEATAFALRALLTIDPQNKLIEPVTNWLIKNRRGAQWSNTRDTAIVVLAMNDYLRTSGELKPDLEYDLMVNGKSIAKKKVSGADVFNAPSRFAIDPKLVKDANEIRIVRKRGDTPLYFAVEGKCFSLEEPVTPAGNEIFVKREYFKLVGRPTLLKGHVYDREPLRDGDTVKSGERVETLVTIEGKNNYEYLLFEDLKPAGFEAVQIRSGESLYARELKSGAGERKHGDGVKAEKGAKAVVVKSGDTLSKIALANGTSVAALKRLNNLNTDRIRVGQKLVARPTDGSVEDSDFTGRQRWVYQELRDRKVALFLDKLPEGVWQIRYDLRAEVPGKFHALPVVGHAMYVPEIRCNGEELRVNVEDTNEAD